jgi:hypothetical protein
LDTGLLFAGCNRGQVHLYDLNLCTNGTFENPNKPSISLNLDSKHVGMAENNQQNLAINHISMRLDPQMQSLLSLSMSNRGGFALYDIR